MNLQPIAGRYTTPFTFTCCKCGIRRTTNSQQQEGASADLDGPPFAAYYCAACVVEISTPAKARQDLRTVVGDRR